MVTKQALFNGVLVELIAVVVPPELDQTTVKGCFLFSQKENMKRCSKCKKTKAKSEFSRDRTNKDGLQGWCKKCMAEYRKTPRYKAANKRYETSSRGKATRKRYEQSETRKASKRLRNESDAYKAARKRYQQSKRYKLAQKRYNQSDAGKATRKRYAQSEEHKATQKRYQQSGAGKANRKRYRKAHPERIKATAAVNQAVATGKLPRISTQACKCSDPADHYHHHSYEPEYWLDVEAVCRGCHTEIHA